MRRAAHIILRATLLATAACGTQVEVEPILRGGSGESCEANDHCRADLVCVDLVCQKGGATDAGPDAVPPLASVRSGSGQSCGRRADCADGLSCIDWQCLDVGAGEVPVSGPTRGGRGESCLASNDCASGLGCVDGQCKQRDLEFSVEAKECFRDECIDDDDCCQDFAAADPALCDDLEQGCASGAESDCNLYQSLCVCHRGCEDGVCVAARECDVDGDCGGSGVLRCVGGRCGQCSGDSQCIDSVCIGHFCRSQCERDEHCPLLHVCSDHRCEERGCQTDKECVFVTGDLRSICDDGRCVTECANDSECGVFDACVEGRCRFVGCEADAECRAVLEGDGAAGRASCRLPIP